MQTTFVLELQFAPEELCTVDIGPDGGALTETLCTYWDKYYGLRAFCMYDKDIAFNEYNNLICAEY